MSVLFSLGLSSEAFFSQEAVGDRRKPMKKWICFSSNYTLSNFSKTVFSPFKWSENRRCTLVFYNVLMLLDFKRFHLFPCKGWAYLDVAILFSSTQQYDVNRTSKYNSQHTNSNLLKRRALYKVIGNWKFLQVKFWGFFYTKCSKCTKMWLSLRQIWLICGPRSMLKNFAFYYFYMNWNWIFNSYVKNISYNENKILMIFFLKSNQRV